MRKLVYSKTNKWVAFPKAEIPITLAVYQTPSGFSVYIDGENRQQALTREQAITLYGELAGALWGKKEEPIIPDDTGLEADKIYCKTCGRVIGEIQTDYGSANVTRTYIVKKTLEHSCCRKTRSALLK